MLQIVFSYFQNGGCDRRVAENELHLSLRRSYDLYYYFLLLIPEVTRLHERQIEMRKNRYLPTQADLNPNMRLVNNRFARQIEINETLNSYVKEHGISWADEAGFIREILLLILSSDIYKEYIADANDSYDTDREFWRKVFRQLICGNDNIEETLENISIYWNDDIGIIQTFVLKTIKQFNEEHGSREKLLPMFKDEEDRDFASTLFRHTIEHANDYRDRINRHMRNWETERVASMDMVIMLTAIAEIVHFPKIPISVTLNEYIDAAKYYSTPKSGTFINGILDAIVKELRTEGSLLKN